MGGSGLEKYRLSNSRIYDFPTRWTAIVVLEDQNHTNWH
ncbi:Uncharacterised protein [Yersinia pekkanenii]|uniref:Uncharacterized protein n=1 Tax=Yersinia pekkanenii TaxID=1288385 RepID=A0A0T9REG2_9GAMM|nr:Uncharacterised protein [Yersinia pekkanenii]CRY69462.1 Uncharacterised protein [Yersinia pekkanenii]